MRTLVVLLSLGLVFVTGLVVGMDRDNQTGLTDLEADVEQADEKQVIVEEIPPEKEPEMSESPEYLTQKIAQLLESAVKGFYETVVDVTYDMVQVFF